MRPDIQTSYQVPASCIIIILSLSRRSYLRLLDVFCSNPACMNESINPRHPTAYQRGQSNINDRPNTEHKNNKTPYTTYYRLPVSISLQLRSSIMQRPYAMKITMSRTNVAPVDNSSRQEVREDEFYRVNSP